MEDPAKNDEKFGLSFYFKNSLTETDAKTTPAYLSVIEYIGLKVHLLDPGCNYRT